MKSYDEEIQALQAKAMADLQKELAKRQDPLGPERDTFLMLLVKTRMRKGLSQAELAARLNMQQPAIARIESGRGNPGLRTLLTIAKALETSLMLKYKH